MRLPNLFKILRKSEPEPEPEPEPYYGYEVQNLCSSCLHLNRENPTTCTAFPGGIPATIIMGVFDHHYLYDIAGVSDEGTVYEPE